MAWIVVAYTLVVVAVAVVEGLSAPDPPRSNIRFREGVYSVHAVMPGDVLDRAGVRAGDRIVALDGEPFPTIFDFWDRFRLVAPGEEVTLRVLRDGQTLAMSAATRVCARPSAVVRVGLPVLALIGIGVGVFLARPRLTPALLLLVYCLCSAINDIIQITYLVGTAAPQRLLTFAYAMTSLPSTALLLHLFLSFPYRGAVQRRLRWALPVAYAVQLGLGLDYYLPSLLPASAAVLSAPVVAGFLFKLFTASTFACYALCVVSLVATFLSTADERLRAQATILGTALGLLFVLYAALVELPLRLSGRLLLDSQSLCLVDLILPAGIAVAIVSQRLFDINVLIRHGLVYGTASAMVVGVFIGLMALLGWIAQRLGWASSGVLVAVAAAVSALLLDRARRWAQNAVDRVLYRRRYSYKQMLTEAGTRLAGLMELPAAVEYLHSCVRTALEPQWLQVVVRERSGPGFERRDQRGRADGRLADEEAAALVTLVGDHETPFEPPAGSGVGGRQPSLVVPVVRGGRLLGALLLGPRPAEIPYLPEDRDFVATLAGITGVVVDHARELQDRAMRERLALLGTAASSIVHELKNPLGAMHSTLAVLRRRLGQDPEGRELTTIVEDEVERLKERVMNVLAFVRPGQEELSVVALDEVLEQLMPMVAAEMRQLRIEVELATTCGHCEVRGDADRLRQVVLNLLLNAREAMADGGRIEVTLRRDGSEVELVVADSGPGFPSQELQRVFEPFFTTKSLGTGLGLANVKRIVEELGGSVGAANREGGGAVVRVILPAVGI